MRFSVFGFTRYQAIIRLQKAEGRCVVTYAIEKRRQGRGMKREKW
jgi:hypothetical protein